MEAAPRKASVGAVVLRKGISPLYAYLTSELMLFRGNSHFPWVRKSDWGVILSEDCTSPIGAGGSSCSGWSDTPALECQGVTPACWPSPLLGPCCRPSCPLLCSLTLLGCSCLCLESLWGEGIPWHRARGLALCPGSKRIIYGGRSNKPEAVPLSQLPFWPCPSTAALPEPCWG